MANPDVPSLFNINVDKIQVLDTQDAQSLYTIWSAISKCSNLMDEGKRLENLSWRVWNRETFCCTLDNPKSRRFNSQPSVAHSTAADESSLPQLSSSVESATSSQCDHTIAASPEHIIKPAHRSMSTNTATSATHGGREKHVTPTGLKEMVETIKESKSLEPLPPLEKLSPSNIAVASPPQPQAPLKIAPPALNTDDRTPRSNTPHFMAPESSTSTVATTVDSERTDSSPHSRTADTETVATEMSTHSIVRGFSLGQISSSYRSQSNAHMSPDPLPIHHRPSKRKGGMFQIGANSSEEPESSLETHMQDVGKNALGPNASSSRNARGKKQASFKEEVSTRMIRDAVQEHEEVFESDEDDEEVSESAIEDEDEEDWEDSITESGHSSVDERQLFQRVDSRPKLTSQRSMLTTMMHERDRAAALQNGASATMSTLRRSRTSTPNGPSMATSPQEQSPLEVRGRGIPRPSLAIPTPNHGYYYPPALSPRSTRRNMLSTELTESLRNHLLWERKQKNSTSNAAIKRRHTSQDVKNLQRYPGEGHVPGPVLKNAPNDAIYNNNNTWNNHFDQGLQDFHQKGW